MRFQSIDEIDRRAIKSYVREAIDLVEKGVEIRPDRGKPATKERWLEKILP